MFLLDKKSSTAAGPLMQVPPVPSKESLGLTQPYLIFQLRALAKRPFTIEVNILSHKDKRQRYRLHLSNKFRSVEVNQMHTQIPLGSVLTPDTWTHLVIDVSNLTSFFFRNRDFGSIDSISIQSGCRRRVSVKSLYMRMKISNDFVQHVCRKCLRCPSYTRG